MKSRIISYRHSSPFALCPSCNRYLKTKTLCGVFQALFFESRGRSFFCSIFMLYPADQFCSQELICTCECFFGTQWLRIAKSKGPTSLVYLAWRRKQNRLPKRCFFSVCICVTRWTKSRRRKLYLYVKHQRQNLIVLSDFYHSMWQIFL